MMQSETQSTLNRYAAAFTKIKESVKDEHAAAVIPQEAAGNRRAGRISAEQQAERAGQEGEPATPKQLEFLKCLRMPIPQGLTKQAASRLIDEGKAKRLAEKLESL